MLTREVLWCSVFFCSVREGSRRLTRRAGKPLALARREEIAGLLRESGAITIAELEERFGVSSMTVRRDLDELERKGRARRTHGGAILPTLTAQEDSFASRLAQAAEAKKALARAAATIVQPGESVFLDSSTTSYVLARRLVARGVALTVITNSLPIMHLVATEAQAHVTLVGLGGMLRRLTGSYVGPLALHGVSTYFADRLFLSVKGLSETGVLTDADPLEAEVKRTMIDHADRSYLLVDESKLDTRALSRIASVDQLAGVVVHGARAEYLAWLRAKIPELAVAGDVPERGADGGG
jgi:DeoR/GlpR family transcriptional regulator of sugar metabolism